MRPNIDAINTLIREKFEGKKNRFANAIGVERSHVSKVLSKGKGAGSLFFGGLIRYCEQQGLNYKEYIFLPENCEKN